jgi:hypothetical protein
VEVKWRRGFPALRFNSLRAVRQLAMQTKSTLTRV